MHLKTLLFACGIFLTSQSAAILQVVGFGLLIAACSLVWGVVGGLVAGGVSLLVVGVALERAS